MLITRLVLALAATGAVACTAAPARAQLTLRDAFAEAGRAGFDNRVAAGNAAAGRARVLAPLEGILPKVRVDAGYARTTDPIGVFGATLRQRSVTEANFAPGRLNYPAAIGNYAAAVVLEQPILNADAWVGTRSAIDAAQAGRATEEWTQRSTRVEVVRAYYGIVLADERVAALRMAARAAHAHVAEAEALVRQGVVTKSDALLASVRAGDVDAQLAEAEGAAAISRRQLALLLGRAANDPAAVVIAATHLPSTERLRAEIAPDTIDRAAEGRADLRAATDALAAARGDALRAKASLLPRVNGFARYDWNSPASLYTGERNWTVGVMASWKPFAGASELADVKATIGRAQAASAQAEGARARAAVEIEQTRTALSVALIRLDIAERAAAQSAEAHRIVSRKYGGGLAGVVELLETQAVETESALALSQARFGTIAAAAERRRALGLDPASLAVLDETGAISALRAPSDP
jgi:outer membrane protein TolC